MGAVVEKGEEPMLVMEYMDYGSLYDILHNETFPLDGDLLLPILRDIAQGVRFLHAATPLVIHGDLKAANCLVDRNVSTLQWTGIAIPTMKYVLMDSPPISSFFPL